MVERDFYKGLGDCINAVWMEVFDESDENNGKHDRAEDDEEMLWEFMEKERKQWMGKEEEGGRSCGSRMDVDG